MKNNNLKIKLAFLGGFLIPPLIWNFTMWYYGIVNSEEILVLATVPAQGIYAISYIAFVLYQVGKRTKVIDEYIESGEHDLAKVQKSINFLPKFYLLTIAIYCIIGPNSGMLFVDFLTRQDYIYGMLLALPLILLFALPFFNLMIYLLQDWTKEIALSQKHKFLSLKSKLAITMLVTVFGVLSLLGIFSLTSFELALEGAELSEVVIRVLVLAVLSVVVSIINFNLLAKQVVNPVRSILKKAKADDFAGDMEINIRDEIGQLASVFNQIVSDMKNLIVKIDHAVANLSAYSEELSASAESGDVTLESANFGKISAGLQEISATTEEATAFAQESSSKTEVGTNKVEDAIDSIENIDNGVKEMAEVMNGLDNNSNKIGEIINLISNIAEQTNLLALNAAIEAARAGEHGQGFAVVAEEIRSLAEETASATEDIANLINETQNKTTQGLDYMDMVEQRVEEGQKIVKETGEVFTDIKGSAEEASTQISQTSHSIQDLAKSSEQLIKTSDNINNMSNEISTSAKDLAEMAEELQEIINE